MRAWCGLDLPDAPSASPRRVEVDEARRWWHTSGAASGARLGDVRAGIEALVTSVLAAMKAGAEAATEGKRT